MYQLYVIISVLTIFSIRPIYLGVSPVYIDKTKPYSLATNSTSVVNNIIDNPSKEEKDIQNKYNIKSLKDAINKQYGINLGAY